ncbi:MAG TPA: FAD-dependent oxidoreductase [Hyphomicrobiaceae bacterium]|nr:FAD-dependent oxidoreductase [Hyphomicrobiaceae bacterium]
MAELAADDGDYDVCTEVVVVGAGAAGLVAALAAAHRGLDVIVVERDAVPKGSTSLSAGLIPAPGTRYQRAAGISDSVELFAGDVLRKAGNEPDADTVRRLAGTIGPAIEWLDDQFDLPFSVVDNFSYPGHSALRMHGLPTRSGSELMDRLRTAAENSNIEIVTGCAAEALICRGRSVTGIVAKRGDGRREKIGSGAVVLASNGYGGNRELVRRHIPEIADALYFGHPGNMGDAIQWGEALGAATRHLSGYQGHGSVAHPHGILITWATITEGGFQVDLDGRRFFDESKGYSEAAASVAAARDGVAWTIFDRRISAIAAQFEDFRTAEKLGAIIRSDSVEDLASKARLPEGPLVATFADVDTAKRAGAIDRFGRNWANVARLEAPYCAVKVTGALFHTQGGLVVDDKARVVDARGEPFPNLYAVGGAAAGVSGSTASGYLSGNGLLTAVGYGFIAGRSVLAERHGGGAHRD